MIKVQNDYYLSFYSAFPPRRGGVTFCLDTESNQRSQASPSRSRYGRARHRLREASASAKATAIADGGARAVFIF
jgi:hypothetical protein